VNVRQEKNAKGGPPAGWGQLRTGQGQLNAAHTGVPLDETQQKLNDIMSGPLTGVPTYFITGNLAKASRVANGESLVMASTGLVNSKNVSEGISNAVDYGLSVVGLAGDSGCGPN
jgi:hypothetical protein